MKKKDLIFSMATIIFGIIIVLVSKDMPRGAAIFPVMIGALMILLGSILLYVTIRANYPVEGPTNISIPYKELGLFIVLLVVFYLVFEHVGYIIATALSIFLTTILSNYKNYKVSIITSVVISIAMFLIFSKLFSVSLPSLIL